MLFQWVSYGGKGIVCKGCGRAVVYVGRLPGPDDYLCPVCVDKGRFPHDTLSLTARAAAEKMFQSASTPSKFSRYVEQEKIGRWGRVKVRCAIYKRRIVDAWNILHGEG